jgi:hypothetical protein
VSFEFNFPNFRLISTIQELIGSVISARVWEDRLALNLQYAETLVITVRPWQDAQNLFA